ncbi:hypothetical protein CR161_02520 [Prosthecochloris sp. ZM]|uniref:hypothetical protein n=1 Tax=Prosthecochloris sp. ZM TaxID=2283143 RepID=UPI000DF7E183|nr:hypothetical protein [Prosthecochloris sp. ZM]RDD29668.1 hypothetical protein CR161_02520 [Prosthecochloris sp. ZM]
MPVRQSSKKSAPAQSLEIHASKGGRLYINPSDLFANAKLFNTIEKSKGYDQIKQEIEANASQQAKATQSAQCSCDSSGS